MKLAAGPQSLPRKASIEAQPHQSVIGSRFCIRI